MQSISTALSALISREQYRLKRASKVAKTDGQTAKLGDYSRKCGQGLMQQRSCGRCPKYQSSSREEKQDE